jgi:hypothetical protein
MTAPARTCGQQETTGLAPGFPARDPCAEAFLLTSAYHHNPPARAGDGPVPGWRASAASAIHRARPSVNQPTGRNPS